MAGRRHHLEVFGSRIVREKGIFCFAENGQTVSSRPLNELRRYGFDAAKTCELAARQTAPCCVKHLRHQNSKQSRTISGIDREQSGAIRRASREQNPRDTRRRVALSRVPW